MEGLRTNALVSHDDSTKHKLCMKKKSFKENTSAIKPIKQVLQKMEMQFEHCMVNAFHVAYYIAKNEKPYSDFPGLIALNVRTGSQMPLWYKSDIACNRFIYDIYNEQIDQLITKLCEARFFSVMIDGSTDSANIENELVYVRYLDMGTGVVTSFIGIEDTKHATAEGILETVDAIFTRVGVLDWRNKVVALGTDGAAVNLGSKDGVAAKLRRDISHLVTVHCIAHRLELGILNAIQQHPRLTQLNDALAHLYEQYKQSPKALRELKMLGEVLEEKVLKPTNLSGARWLPFHYRALLTACQSYRVFVTHFEEIISPDRPRKSSPTQIGRAKNLLKFMKDFECLLFMFFMCDILHCLSQLSLTFQKDDLTVGEALEKYEETCLQITDLVGNGTGIWQSKVMAALITTPAIYEGVELNNVNATPSATETRTRVKEDICSSILRHLDDRLKDLSQDSILAQFKALDPSTWPNLDHHDFSSKKSFIESGKQNVITLHKHYINILRCTNVAVESLLSEFVGYKTYALSRRNIALRTLFSDIVRTPNTKSKFPGLATLMELYLIMPISTACCERGFSCMKRIKNDWRASLKTPSLTRLMYLSLEGPHPDVFDARAAVHRWWGQVFARGVLGSTPTSTSKK